MTHGPRQQQTAMLGAWRELEARGRSVKAVKIGPDGAIILLTESPDDALPSLDSDWVDLAGETALPRA
jgi:hypothetical protein